MNPYKVILSRHVTEKAMILAGLETSTSNRCTRKCESPKAVFIVSANATKEQIGRAIEEIYREKNVKVVKVNTVTIHRKKRRVRGRSGYKAGYKKAIVTFEKGDRLEET